MSESISTIDRTESENDVHHEFIPRDPPESEQNEKYPHVIS